MRRFQKGMIVAVAVLGLMALAPGTVHACATCFGESDSPLAKGMNMGIFTLLGVLGLVMAGAVSFFVFLARRAAADEEGQAGEVPGDSRRFDS